MTTIDSSPDVAGDSALGRVLAADAAWLTSSDHKRIGRLFVSAGLLGLLATVVVNLLIAIERVDGASAAFDSDSWSQLVASQRVGLVFGTALPLVTGIALLALRMIAGTVGAALSRFDVPVVVVVGVLCVLDPVSWIMGLAVAIGLWSAPEVGSLRRIGLVALGVGIACGVGLGAWQGTLGLDDVEITGTAYALAAAGGLAMVFAAQPLPVTSPTDAGGAIVDPRRIRLARVAAGSFVMWAAVVGGVDGFWSISPVFAALVAAAIYRVFIQPAHRRSQEHRGS